MRRFAWMIVALSLCATTPLYAQVAASSLRGKVTTEDGQPVPGATVTITNQKTGSTQSSVTDSNGGYRFAGLQPSSYDIVVTLAGFADSKSAITAQVGQTATVDVTMRPQAVTGEMTVTAEAPLIEPTETDLSSVISEEKIENLPLAGRKWQDLAILAPGAAPGNGDFNGSFDPTKSRVGAISVGGNLGREVGVTIDGGDNTDDVVGGILMQFSADAIQEFEVVTQSYKAEFGKSSNGMLNVVTKSGTNNLDGTVFGFFRNQSLRALTPAQQVSEDEDPSFEKPDFHFYQFGGTLGGPIIRDKTHFFLSYERLDEEQTFDLDATLLEVFGTGGVGCAASGGDPTFCLDETTVPQPFTQDLILGKIDHQLNDEQRLSARLSFEFNENASGDQLTGNLAPSAAAVQTNDHISILGSHTWTIGDKAVNEIKVQYQDFENNIVSVDDSLATVVYPSGVFGANTNTPQTTLQTKYQFRDDFTYYAGNHTVKAGLELIHEPELGGNFAFLSSGYFVYADDTDPLDAASYFYAFAGNADLDHSLNQIAIYLQDDWEVASNLTLNLGVRYDADPGELDLDSNQFTQNVAAAVESGRAPMFERAEIKDDLNNIAPRLGFAWDVGGKGDTVVRGSYGHFFDQPYDNLTLFNQFESKGPNECSEFTAVGCGPYRTVFIEAPAFGPDNVPDNPAAVPGAVIGSAIRIVSPDLKYPFTRQVTIGGTHQFNRNISVSADGVFSWGFNQFRRRRIEDSRDLTTDDNDILTTVDLDGDGVPDAIPRTSVQLSDGTSTYKALQTQLQGRWDKLDMRLTYTFGEAEAQQTDFGTQPVFNDRRNADFFEMGNVPGDIRHRGVLSATYSGPWDINIGGIVQAASAPPYTVTRGFMGTVDDPSQSCNVEGNCHPDFENGAPIRFDVNGDGRVDTEDRIGLRQVRGDDFFKVDLRLAKVFDVSEGFSFEILAEVFNLTNAENFGSLYTGDVRSPGFGQPNLQLTTTPREFQLGARVRF